MKTLILFLLILLTACASDTPSDSRSLPEAQTPPQYHPMNRSQRQAIMSGEQPDWSDTDTHQRGKKPY